MKSACGAYDHIGHYIKKQVIPKDLTVTKAATVLGIGRPALSNLLNGNAALSIDMALRLQRAFGADSESLLKMQAEIENAQSREREAEIPVRTFSRSFLEIRAKDIEGWAAGRIEPRSELAAFLRRLVNNTGVDLGRVDFPAYDNSERHGWDGYVEARAATPWIPLGVSGWEFGCNADPEKKAQDDYSARINSLSPSERRKITFVFVTPRNWIGKRKWEQKRREEGKFLDVRAFDASDLEQWLEQSVPTQVWFADLINIPGAGLRSLDRCWEEWAEVTKPRLTRELFAGQLDAARGLLKTWLDAPPERPFVITADSQVEGLAFLSCAFKSIGDTESRFDHHCVVIDSADAMKKATHASTNFIAVITSPEAEVATAGLHRKQHVILVRPRNALADRPDVALDALDDDTFRSALLAMNIEEHEVERLAQISGQYPTILRRALAIMPAIKSPPWSEDPEVARKVVRLGLAGAWVSTKQADRDTLSALFDDDYGRVEDLIANLRHAPETPIWEAGNVIGVTSKVDIITAGFAAITPGVIDRFFDVARTVLSEADPALELPEDQRWAAAVFGKSRNHSGTLRDGLCESLVLLAVSGDKLLGQQLGTNLRNRVDVLIRSLLTPFSAQTWLSQGGDLQRYAEAAPDVFLDVVEDDLASADPQILALLAPRGDAFMGGCPRAGLLWALETLAWGPERMPRVVEILAQLSAHKISDNWGNKPERSLASLFRWWMPQTAASLEQRTSALISLCRRHPDAGWRVCMDQLDSHSSSGSARPRWRRDDIGAGEPDTGSTNNEFAVRALDLALAWTGHDHRSLGDLVERLQHFDPERQERLWKSIQDWRSSGPSEQDMALLRERIRRFTDTRRGKRRKLLEDSRAKARSAYESLAPFDPVIRHQWLFANHWVEESIVELEDSADNYEKRQERIGASRVSALKEVWSSTGYDGFIRLCESGNAAFAAGWHLSHDVIVPAVAVEVLLSMASEPGDRSPREIDAAIAGILSACADSDLDEVLTTAAAGLLRDTNNQKAVRLLLAAPFRASTWAHVNRLPTNGKEMYWSEVKASWGRQSADELHVAVAELLAAERPRAAFELISLDLEKIDSEVLVTVLRAIATGGREIAGTNLLSSHQIAKTLEILDDRQEVSKEELALLEFTYIEALDREHGKTSNLERQLAESPIMFVQVLSYLYRRDDAGVDPPEWLVGNPEATQAMADRAYKLLTHARRLPGTKENGQVSESELLEWIIEVRRLAAFHGRADVADKMIGQLLYRSPQGSDGVWPMEPVREALEHVRSKAMASGMALAVYNGRGAVWRGEGGKQERDLASTYRSYSSALAFTHPFTAQFLQQVADFYERDAEREDASALANRRLRRR